MNTPVPETEPFSGTVRIHILHKDAPDSTKPLGVSECQDTAAHSVDGPGGSDACGLGDSISPVEGTTKLEQVEVKCWVQTKMQTKNPLSLQKCPESFMQALTLGSWSRTPPLQCWPQETSHNLYPSPGDLAKLYHCQSLPEPPAPCTHTPTPLPHLSCRNILKPSKQCTRDCIWGGLLLRY